MRSWIAMLTGAVLAGLVVAPSKVDAQSWPSKTVKLIVPLGPSSGADITARVIAERLQTKWGQPVVVENRAGGDGIIGITAFLSSNDDHALFFAPSSTYTAHPFMRGSVPYDANEIIPVVRTSVTLVTVSVPTVLGINTLTDLIGMAKKQPGKLSWSAVTGLNEYQFLAFAKTAGIDMIRVPYRDVNQAVNDLGENRIQVYASAFATARPAVQNGKIKLIALTNSTRFEYILPGVPTAREAGYPALEFDGLVGIFATKLTPAAARSKIETDVLAILADKAVADRIIQTGTAVVPGTSEQFVAAIEMQKKTAAATSKIVDMKQSN